MNFFAAKRAGIFLLISAVALFAALIPFVIRGNPLVWTAMGADGLTQHATFLQYMFENGLLFSGGNVFDINMGLGADAMTSMAYYMMYDPVNLLLYIIPTGNFLAAYSALTVVKLLVTASAMYFFLGDKIRSFKVRTAVSVAYMLSGYVLYTYLRHPDLAAGAMYLPFVIRGLEDVINKKKPFILIFFAFFTLISNFYTFYMTSVFAVFYAVVYYLCFCERAAKPFILTMLRAAGWYMTAILLACFMLLPVAYGYVSAARSAAKGFSPYGIDAFIAVMATFFIPSTGPSFTPVMFTPVTVALAVASATVRKSRAASVCALILTAAVLMPLGGYFFNLFNYVNNRFVYLLSFSALYAAAFVMDADKIEPSQVRTAVKTVCCAAGFIIVVGMWYFGFSGLVGKALSVTVVVLAVPVTAAYAFMLFYFIGRKPSFGKLCAAVTPKRALAAFSAFAFIWALTLTSYYSAEYGGAQERYTALVSPAEAYVAATAGFRRVDYPNSADWYGNYNNRPLNNGIPGTFHYNTVTAESEYSFVAGNLLYNTQGSLGMSGLNGRIAVQALLSVSYYVTDGYIPYGFTSAGVEGLYVTENAIPFGTVYSSAMSAAQYEALPAAEKQHAALSFTAIDGADPVDYDYALEYRRSGDISVTGSYSFSGCGSGGETYLGFTVDVPDEDFTVTIKSDNYTYEQRFFAKGGQFYTGQTEYLYNFGELPGEITVEGNVELKDVYIAYYPYSAFESALAERPHLQDTVFKKSGFTGKISSDGGYMLIPVAWHSGFKAYIDDNETSVLKADEGLMAVAVPAGDHTVRFEYETEYFGLGSAVSAAATGILFAATALYAAETVSALRRRILH